MSDVANLRDTIVPKSDQLNADDLIAGSITVTITGVRRGSPDQPVIVDIDGGFQPYKPCLSMRRVMIAAWGDDGKEWAGKSLTMYNDPSVKFGKVAMGGIRISHMTGLSEPMHMMLTTTRARRANFKVEPLVLKEPEQVKQATPSELWFGYIDTKAGDGVDALTAWFESDAGKENFAKLGSEDQEKVGNYFREKCSSFVGE